MEKRKLKRRLLEYRQHLLETYTLNSTKSLHRPIVAIYKYYEIEILEIPNISRFTEECLRKYLGIGTTLTPLYKQQELLETIGKCHLELHLMNELEHVEEMKREMELEKINYAWRSLFAHYQDTGRINNELLQHAIKVLGINREDLINIIELTYTHFHRDRIDTTDWKKVYEKYGN